MLVNNTLMINGFFMHFIFRAQWWWYQPGTWGMNPADHHEEINPDPAPEVRFPFSSLWYLCTLLLAIYHLTQIQNYRQIGLELISWISCRYMRMTTLLDLFRILLKQSRTQQVKVRIGDPFLAYSFIFLAHICRFFCDTKF